VNQAVSRFQYPLPHLRIRRAQTPPLPPRRSYCLDLLQTYILSADLFCLFCLFCPICLI